MDKTKGDKKQAMHYYNCIRPPLLPIQIPDVVPSYLHILLGIAFKHHKLLKEAAHHVDLLIEDKAHCDATQHGLRIQKYGTVWQAFETLKAQLKTQKTIQALSDCEIQKEQYSILI